VEKASGIWLYPPPQAREFKTNVPTHATSAEQSNDSSQSNASLSKS